jgi:hypothetical protein
MNLLRPAVWLAGACVLLFSLCRSGTGRSSRVFDEYHGAVHHPVRAALNEVEGVGTLSASHRTQEIPKIAPLPRRDNELRSRREVNCLFPPEASGAVICGAAGRNEHETGECQRQGFSHGSLSVCVVVAYLKGDAIIARFHVFVNFFCSTPRFFCKINSDSTESKKETPLIQRGCFRDVSAGRICREFPKRAGAQRRAQ